jgi:hypothetical protein
MKQGGAPIWFSFEKDYSLLQSSTFCFFLALFWLELIIIIIIIIIIIMHKDVIVDREQLLAVNVETRRCLAFSITGVLFVNSVVVYVIRRLIA